jgi:hypothetical protein
MNPAEIPVIVVPCYNEERRLDERAFLDMARTGRARLLFVDDGSTDGTAAALARMAASGEGIGVLTLGVNVGKAEAVRRGLLLAVRNGARVVGYYDADLATPPHELTRLIDTLQQAPELAGVLACRVARLGSSIRRSAWRHYLGRAYATAASVALGVTVYDTQCGAKLFRVNDTLVGALARPFRSPWALDVELLHRLLHGAPGTPPLPETAFVEVPLQSWSDVRGSKLRVGPAFRAVLDLARIARSRVGRPSRGAHRGRSESGPDGPSSVIVPQVEAVEAPRRVTRRQA